MRSAPYGCFCMDSKEVDPVAKKALEKIMEAEAAAELIRSDAGRQADEVRADAHEKGKELRVKMSTELREDKKQMRESAEKDAQLILEKARADAELDAASLRGIASEKLPDATALILERIRTLWQ